jgi:thiol:disulfide interchange protein
MKTSLYTFMIALFAFNVQAQTQSNQTSTPTTTPEVAAVYQAENQGWLTNIDEAYAVSQQSGKPILANFTGSDWCGWCKKLTADVFRHDEFKTWADKNVVLLELDYPRRKVVPQHIQAQNSNLQQAFQVSGYPTVWLFALVKDVEKNQFTVDAYGKTGYTPTVKEFTSSLEQMMAAKKGK